MNNKHVTLKSSVLSLLLRYPTMPLTEIVIRTSASYSYVWQIAKAHGLLRGRDRAVAASVAAPYLDSSKRDLGYNSKDIWSSTHNPSDAPLSHELPVRSPSASVLLSPTINFVTTDHGTYYRVPPSSERTKDEEGYIKDCFIEIFDPNGLKTTTPVFKRAELSLSDFLDDPIISKWLPPKKGVPHKNHPKNFNNPKDFFNFSNTLFYSKPQAWEGVTVGDLRCCLDDCVSYHSEIKFESPTKGGYLKNASTHGMILIEKQSDGSSRVVTSDSVFMRWSKSGKFPFLPNTERVVANYYALRDMLNVYDSLYANDDWDTVENEPVMISHGSPGSGLRVSVGQVCLRSLEPPQADMFPVYEDVIPKAADTHPYAQIHKGSLVSALREAAYSEITDKEFMLKLGTGKVEINKDSNQSDNIANNTKLNARFRVMRRGSKFKKAIGIPYGQKRVEQLGSIVKSIRTKNVIISGKKEEEGPNEHHGSVILISEDNMVPDIGNPDSSGIAFRSVPTPY